MPSNPQHPKRVLIVDAWEVTADTLETIFTHHGYTARATYKTEDALALAQAWQPDLLIAEIIMFSMFSDMIGLELARRLKALYPKCQVILFSGQCAPELQKEARALGFEFFDKPVNPAVLLDKAASLLDHNGMTALE